MPKTIYIPKGGGSSGISITWTPSAGRLDISGWYDHMVGLESRSLSLEEFFNELGITETHIKKALK